MMSSSKVHSATEASKAEKSGTEIATRPSEKLEQVKKESTNGVAGKPSEQQQNPGTPKQKKNREKEGKRKNKPGKIHIRLPSIEAYQKDLCFAAEAPGRVVVRLERLMGSDKIRPVDGKYMETLIQRLEEEEKIAWTKRIRLRKKAEKERYRQLAINGLMEPSPGMEDLYNHPVFRVNRILSRLSSLEMSFSGSILKLPPIVGIEPFENDESGAFFKEYPAHRTLRKNWENIRDKDVQNKPDEEPSKEDLIQSVPRKSRAAETSKASTLSGTLPADLEEEDEYDEELEEIINTPYDESETEMEDSEPEELTEIEQANNELHKEYVQTLAALQTKYGVPKTSGFEDEWKQYLSPLVDKLASEEVANEMFEVGREIFNVYTRQTMVTQDHVKATLKAQKRKSDEARRISGKMTPRTSESTPPALTGEMELEEDITEEEEVEFADVSSAEEPSRDLGNGWSENEEEAEGEE